MNAYDRFKDACKLVWFDDREVKGNLGPDAANKANAILSILMIGDKPSVAYSKAILAAVEVGIERMSTFTEPDKTKN